jgi:hypothetical protein
MTAKERWQRRQFAHFARIRDGLVELYDYMDGLMHLSDDMMAREQVKRAFRVLRQEIGDFFAYQLGVDVSKARYKELQQRIKGKQLTEDEAVIVGMGKQAV